VSRRGLRGSCLLSETFLATFREPSPIFQQFFEILWDSLELYGFLTVKVQSGDSSLEKMLAFERFEVFKEYVLIVLDSFELPLDSLGLAWNLLKSCILK